MTRTAGSAAEGQIGLFFRESSVKAIIEVVEYFETMESPIDPHTCRRRAEAFSPERFRREIWDLLTEWCPWLLSESVGGGRLAVGGERSAILKPSRPLASVNIPTSRRFVKPPEFDLDA